MSGSQPPTGGCTIGGMNKQLSPDDPDSLLSLLQQVKQHYQPPLPPPRKRGKKPDFSALSFLLVAVVAVLTRTFRDSELRKLLERDSALLQALGMPRVPHRTTIGRRLASLVEEAETQVNLLGHQIVTELKPKPCQSQVSAIDGRMYQANGNAWHKSSRQKGVIPVGVRNIDTESSWSKSGYRGWVQGYRLVLQGLVFPHPVPIFAAWRANNLNEAAIAVEALEGDQLQVTDVLLGDTTFGSGRFSDAYKEAGGWVVTPSQLPQKRRSWKCDLYDYRKETIELLFQRIIQAAGLKQCQVKGRGRNGAFVLASVWLYQVCFLTDYREGKPACHVKEQLDCARWRIKS
jgi:hypothetical protein